MCGTHAQEGYIEKPSIWRPIREAVLCGDEPSSTAFGRVSQLPQEVSSASRVAVTDTYALTVGRDVVVSDRQTGEEELVAAGRQVRHPQLSGLEPAGCLPAQLVIQLLSIGRKTPNISVAFARNLALATSMVHPNGALTKPEDSDKGATVGRHGEAFLLRRPKGNLFGRAVREPLPPDVEGAAGIRV